MTKTNKTSKKASKAALDNFKYEVANEIGVDLKQGYNGELSAKEAGAVGGNMVKKMVERQKNQLSGNNTNKK